MKQVLTECLEKEEKKCYQDTIQTIFRPIVQQSSNKAECFHSVEITGADPDNVAQQETVGELLPLRTRELPAAKSHDGKVSELLTSRESVELSNVLLNKTQVQPTYVV